MSVFHPTSCAFLENRASFLSNVVEWPKFLDECLQRHLAQVLVVKTDLFGVAVYEGV